MPPEQARGQPVDERADVYSLGAMLYYLLVGVPPYSGTTVQDVLAAAATQRPDAVEAREPGAPGDLVAIVTKAMDPDPAGRYATAASLAADLRRFQTGQLVSAHHYSPGELLRRWVRQHRAAVTVAAVFGLALAAAIAVGFVAVERQARIAEAERDRARLEAAKATQVNAFLHEMLASADPRTEGRQVTVVSLLDRAAARLDQELASQPEVKASLQLTLGQSYEGLGLLEPAERHARAALAARQTLLGPDHADVARAQKAVASLLLEKGDLAAAEALYRESLATFARAGEADTDDAFTARSDLAATLENLGRLDEAETVHREVIARTRRVQGSDSAALAASLNNLGVVLGQRGDWAGAEPLHRESLDIIRRARGPRSPETAAAMTSLANAVESRGELEAAERLYRDALEIRREALGNEHPDTARALYALAGLLRARGQPAQAEALCREALALRGRVLPDSHPMVAALLQVRGLSLLDLGPRPRGRAYAPREPRAAPSLAAAGALAARLVRERRGRLPHGARPLPRGGDAAACAHTRGCWPPSAPPTSGRSRRESGWSASMRPGASPGWPTRSDRLGSGQVSRTGDASASARELRHPGQVVVVVLGDEVQHVHEPHRLLQPRVDRRDVEACGFQAARRSTKRPAPGGRPARARRAAARCGGLRTSCGSAGRPRAGRSRPRGSRRAARREARRGRPGGRRAPGSTRPRRRDA